MKRFFLEHENYFSLKLPDYINFQEVLDKLSVEIGEGNYTSILEKDRLPDNYDDINYTLYNNKDGNYDWRPFQIINPVIYISLINVLSKKDNWNEILKRFKEIDKISVILRDNSFKNDVDKTNAIKKLEQIGINEIRSI